MRANQWWSFLAGYLTITVEGERLEPFINMAMTRGIQLWDLKRESGNLLTAKVRVSGFFGLRHIARRNRCRLSIKLRHGFPFLAVRLKKRKMIMVGAVFFVVLLYVCSSLIWFIDVEGNQQVAAEEILMVARREGFVPGTPRWWLDKNRLEKVLSQEFPQVAFFSVEVRGTQVRIEVVEKRLPPQSEEEKEGRSHIVAARGGVVEDIIVLVGEPMVKPGDTVRTGKVLISGIVPVPGTGSSTPLPGVVLPPPASLEPETVNAQGVVKARVWYASYGESQILDKVPRNTGRQVVRLHLISQGREVTVYGPRDIPYTRYQLEQKEMRIKNLPVVAIWEKVVELEYCVIDHGADGARELAVAKARSEIERTRMPGSETVSDDVELVPLGDPNLVRVRVRVEALEEIGVRQAF